MVPSSLQSLSLTRLRLFLLPLLLAVVVSCANAPAVLKRPGVFRILNVLGDSYHAGTGFLAPGQCMLIITAAHVVERPGSKTYVVADGVEIPYIVTKSGKGKKDDAALLTPAPTANGANGWPDLCKGGVSPYRWGKGVEVNEDLWYHGLWMKLNYLLTGRAYVTHPEIEQGGYRYLLISAPSLMPGMSGSPLFNSKGEVVGLMIMSMGTDAGPTHFEVAVPTSVIRKVLDL